MNQDEATNPFDPKRFRDNLKSVRDQIIKKNMGDENAGHPRMGEWLAEIRILDTLIAGIDSAMVVADPDDPAAMVAAAVIHETYGKHPGASIELIDEGDHWRVRVREYSGKASIFLTDTEIDRLGKEIAYMKQQRSSRVK